ncbi:hypothetical protein KSB_32250 [Ktedonobacter robiniae]|uniref:Uncharacterized protein n=1 Tax=Ktedonobacter robiniae TaxID=2778365 RepID=A0ABQ3UPZ3_9CHLR|nr:hypothetical protein KSB_32250 [Ktedonobacter robiniae]
MERDHTLETSPICAHSDQKRHARGVRQAWYMYYDVWERRLRPCFLPARPAKGERVPGSMRPLLCHTPNPKHDEREISNASS